MLGISPSEFRKDVVGVTHRCEYEVTIKQIVEGCGISEGCPKKLVRKVEIEAGRNSVVISANVCRFPRTVRAQLTACVRNRGGRGLDSRCVRGWRVEAFSPVALPSMGEPRD